MALSEDVFFLSAVEVAARVRRRELSPVELVDGLFERIERVDRPINAYCTLAPEQARVAALEAEERARRGEPLGPLDGVPVSIKDNVETAGIRTTYGSRIFEHNVPDQDAVAVTRLKAAGAIVLGKTSLPEFAAKSVVDPPLFGHTRNPWNLDRIPGGSSGGAAAAVAAGLGPIALGNDAAGSVRIPASCCGVAGLKPSAGRVPQWPNSNPWEIASQAGPLARTVNDLDVMFRVIAGPDERDPLSLPAIPEAWERSLDDLVRAWRIAWSPDLGFGRVEREVLAIVTAALEGFGDVATVEPVGLELGYAEDAYYTLSATRRAAATGPLLEQWSAVMDPFIVEYVGEGLKMTPADIGRAIGKRTKLYAAIEELFRTYDLLITPTLSTPPFEVGLVTPAEIDGQPTTSWRDWYPFTYPFNLTGHPAASVPAGWTTDGLPVGIQVVGHRFADRDVLAACRQLERARPWANRRPPVGAAAV